MNITVKMRKGDQSFKKVAFYYAGSGWVRIWFWPTSKRWSVLINRDEVIQVEHTKKLVINESNASVNVI